MTAIYWQHCVTPATAWLTKGIARYGQQFLLSTFTNEALTSVFSESAFILSKHHSVPHIQYQHEEDITFLFTTG